MGYQHAIAVGPEFFQKAKNDYSNWRWALAREYLQNSIDCGSDHIDVRLQYLEDLNVTTLAVNNNGEPMTKETLTGKLLSLGSSGKDFNNSVGGFGKAKEILYFCHESYEIITGNLTVRGAGAGYNLTEGDNERHGTLSTITIKGNEVDDLARQFKRFIYLSAWKGTFTINGETIEDRLNKGAHRRDFDWCQVHSNKSFEGLMVVRMEGMPMFTRDITFKGTIVVTMTGKSADYLTSNRDGLNAKYGNDLDRFVVNLAVNKRSALKPKQPKRSKYDGYKLKGFAARVDTTKPTTELATEEISTTTTLSRIFANANDAAKDAIITKIVNVLSNVQRMEFHINVETDLKIPDYYAPDQFSDYARTLVERWASILVEIAIMERNDKPFSIGFCFTEDAVAQHDGGVLLINPVKIDQQPGKPRTMSRRWTFNNEGNWDLVASAAHEWVHFMGHSDHDEDYSSALTELFGRCLANRSKFGSIFQGGGRVKWPKS